MEFEILERSTGDEPPMGSAVTLGPPVLRLLEQMGLLSQIERASKPVVGLTIVDGEGKRLGRVDGVEEDRYGYPIRVITHHALHRILLDRVPKANLHRGKFVVETLQNPNGVSCKCSDGSTYYGDIIIGADGPQSLTRERMFKQLKDQGKLPDSDMEASCYEHLCIGGITNPLDQRDYPTAHDDTAEFQVIYTKEVPYTVSSGHGATEQEKVYCDDPFFLHVANIPTFLLFFGSSQFWYMPVAENRVAWGICHIIPPKFKYHPYSHAFSLSDPSQTPELFAPGSNRPFPAGSVPVRPHLLSPPISRSPSQTKILDDWFVPSTIDLEKQFKEVMDSRCLMGSGLVRDFLANTPTKTISMLELEDRICKTWYSGRIVLIGEAAHQV